MSFIPICRGKNGNIWVYGFFEQEEIFDGEMSYLANRILDVDGIRHDIDKSTLGMSTGMLAEKSHRGESELDRMIFDGDICFYDFSNEDFGLCCTRFVVKYDEKDAKFIFWDIDLRECCEMKGKSWADVFAIDCEIIGNVHDNQELLED